MNKTYEVTRSYTTCDVHIVEAKNEEEAKRKVVKQGEYINCKSYDSDYDDEVTVWEVTDSELHKGGYGGLYVIEKSSGNG